MYIRTYIHAYIHTDRHTYMHNYMHTYMYVCIYIYIYILLHFTSALVGANEGPQRVRERGGGGRAQPAQDRVPLKASRIGKRHNSSGSPGTIMRPGSPRLRVVMVKRDMQLSNLRGESALCCHDTRMPMQEARNTPKGSISKDLAHQTVVCLGRGGTVNAVSTLA